VHGRSRRYSKPLLPSGVIGAIAMSAKPASSSALRTAPFFFASSMNSVTAASAAVLPFATAIAMPIC
jgi:hypothetical protein